MNCGALLWARACHACAAGAHRHERRLPAAQVEARAELVRVVLERAHQLQSNGSYAQPRYAQ
jgi:hypothetical protein